MGSARKPIVAQSERLSTAMPVGKARQPLILVVEDGCHLSQAIHPICDFLDVAIKQVASADDITPILNKQQPMAVLAEIDAQGQDGCHVMKTVASHDPSLPILLLTGNDPALVGAADAVEEIWGLSHVCKRPILPALGELVDFLFRAGQHGRCLGLMPA